MQTRNQSAARHEAAAASLVRHASLQGPGGSCHRDTGGMTARGRRHNGAGRGLSLCARELSHPGIEGSRQRLVKCPEIGGSSAEARDLLAQVTRSPARHESLTPLHLRCTCGALSASERNLEPAECREKKTASEDDQLLQSLPAALAIVACMFTALSGGLPIKWVLQLLEVIQ